MMEDIAAGRPLRRFAGRGKGQVRQIMWIGKPDCQFAKAFDHLVVLG